MYKSFNGNIFDIAEKFQFKGIFFKYQIQPFSGRILSLCDSYREWLLISYKLI